LFTILFADTLCLPVDNYQHIYGFVCKPLLKSFQLHRSDPEGYYIGLNFGSLQIDWENSFVQVTIHDAISGEAVLQTGPLSIIGQKPKNIDEVMIEQVPTCMNGHLLPVALGVVSGMVLIFTIFQRT
jgi:hypothetical protein